MTEIVRAVRGVNDVIGEIASAAGAQNEGIEQISTAVDDLDQMTQQNAALVEESAAAAESLKEQAKRLAGVVSKFRLGDAAGHGAAPLRASAHDTVAVAAIARAKAQAARPVAPVLTAVVEPAEAPSAANKAGDDWESF